MGTAQNIGACAPWAISAPPVHRFRGRPASPSVGRPSRSWFDRADKPLGKLARFTWWQAGRGGSAARRLSDAIRRGREQTVRHCALRRARAGMPAEMTSSKSARTSPCSASNSRRQVAELPLGGRLRSFLAALRSCSVKSRAEPQGENWGICIARTRCRKRKSLCFQFTVVFPSWTSRVPTTSPAKWLCPGSRTRAEVVAVFHRHLETGAASAAHQSRPCGRRLAM